MSPANDEQVGGDHYKRGAGHCPHCGGELEHWDIVEMFGLGYLVGTLTKYLFRFRYKDGMKDIQKARHYFDKLIEVEKAKLEEVQPGSAESLRELTRVVRGAEGVQIPLPSRCDWAVVGKQCVLSFGHDGLHEFEPEFEAPTVAHASPPRCPARELPNGGGRQCVRSTGHIGAHDYKPQCTHDRLDEDGICKACGGDCRGAH